MTGREVSFLFEGLRLTAHEGDSIAAALLAGAVRVFGRSSKYHRPRGYRCGRGHCSACAMRVDGLPGVRTCVTTVRPGMTVEREHAWPSADVDLLRAADALSPAMPPGFYYRRFRRSPRLYGVFERAIAQAAVQVRLPSRQAVKRLAAARCERREQLDVLVVGGGVAGLSAALTAADARAGVLLVEQDDRLGGRLSDGASDTPVGVDLATRTLAHGRIEVLTGAEAVGWYEEGVVAIDRRPDLLLVRPAAAVLATGGYDLGLPFAGWDLPGVMLAAGARRLVHRHGVKPGSRAVVLTTDDVGYDVARELQAAGVEIACVADCRTPQAIRPELEAEAAGAGIPIVPSVEGARAHGLNGVTALSLRVAGVGAGRPLRHDCDLVCISAGVRPADDLSYQASSAGSLVLSAGDASGEPGAGRPWLAGLVAGAATTDVAIEQGKTAGSDAARHVRAASDSA